MTADRPVKHDLGVWLPLLREYRLSPVAEDMLLQGTLERHLDFESPEVVRTAASWPGPVHLERGEEGVRIAVVAPGEAPRRGVGVHVLLFLTTVLTTLGAGALLEGFDPFGTRLLELGDVVLPYPTRVRWGVLAAGVPFALPLLSVLVAHEMGHWVLARRHSIRASLPYFIPFPPYFSIIGTMGAFIRLRGATIRRAHLFDVGVAGPLAGFLVAVPLTAIGLARSLEAVGPADPLTPFFVRFAGATVWLGNGLFVDLMARVFAPVDPGTAPLYLHPMAFAGWLGLFVTSLNLLPLGQLDGGHILYSLFGAAQARIARAFFLLLIPLGFLWWGWWGWALVVALVHRGRFRHPRVVQPATPVGRGRTLLGWLTIVLFVVTFAPIPVAVVP